MDPLPPTSHLQALVNKWDLVPARTLTFSANEWYLPFRRTRTLLTPYYQPLRKRTLYTWAHQERPLSTLPKHFQQLFSDHQQRSDALWFVTYTKTPHKLFFYIPSTCLNPELQARAHAARLLIRAPHGALIQRAQQSVAELFPDVNRRTQLSVLRHIPDLATLSMRVLYKHFHLSTGERNHSHETCRPPSTQSTHD